MKEEKQTEILPVPLTPSEVSQRGAELASAEEALKKAEDALNDQVDRAKAAKKACEEAVHKARVKVSDLAKIVREKSEGREVEVVEQPDYSTSTVHIVRMDTGEIVRPRKMTEADRQRGMFDDAKLRRAVGSFRDTVCKMEEKGVTTTVTVDGDESGK